MNTSEKKSSVVFDTKRASTQDNRLTKLAPMREALHLFIRMVLSELPAKASILCVGAGTGPELIYLAQAFPHMQFTVVEPAAPMLDVCRQRAEETGIISRCTFHDVYLDSLPECSAFDAATSILVSQFFMQSNERSNFFKQIASRLTPGGLLINADLASDMSSPTYSKLFDVWLRTMKFAEIPVEEASKLGRDVAVIPAQEIESIIISGGFDKPVLFFQSLLIHAWHSKLAV